MIFYHRLSALPTTRHMLPRFDGLLLKPAALAFRNNNHHASTPPVKSALMLNPVILAAKRSPTTLTMNSSGQHVGADMLLRYARGAKALWLRLVRDIHTAFFHSL